MAPCALSKYLHTNDPDKNNFNVGTFELAHGINMPSVNPPKTGPPTIPKIPKAAFKNN